MSLRSSASALLVALTVACVGEVDSGATLQGTVADVPARVEALLATARSGPATLTIQPADGDRTAIVLTGIDEGVRLDAPSAVGDGAVRTLPADAELISKTVMALLEEVYEATKESRLLFIASGARR